MKVKLKSERGAITLIVLVAMLFLIAFLMSIYIRIANKAQISAETTKQIAEKYNNIEQANEIYNSYFAQTDVIPIYTRQQLEKVGSGEQVIINGKVYTFSANAYYTIQNNLNLGGYYDETTKTWTVAEGGEWEPLPTTFTGILDGLGHTITGLYINSPEEINQGLFGTLQGTVKNLNVDNSYINGSSYVGAIAGLNEGIIENCYNEATVEGESYVGGIAGNLNDDLRNCLNMGAVIGNANVTGGYFESLTTGEILDVWSNKVLDENAKFISGEYEATVPEGFKVSSDIFEQTIDTGMVIQDNEENEFVWIPCTTNVNDGSGLTLYAKDTKYNDGTLASKQSGYTGVTDWADSGANTSSVVEYGGFYMGRYEAGVPSNASFFGNKAGDTYSIERNVIENLAPVSKANNPGWNYISQGNAEIVAKKMYENSTSVESRIVDSYAWDTTVNWIESKINGIAMNSVPYGNYVNSGLSLVNGLYAEHIIDFSPWTWQATASQYKKGNIKITPRSETGGVTTVYEIASGASEDTKTLNIYDMAGNLWEWTSESSYKNTTTKYAVRRGGSLDNDGSDDSISYRYGSHNTIVTYGTVGFRVVVYIK